MIIWNTFLEAKYNAVLLDWIGTVIYDNKPIQTAGDPDLSSFKTQGYLFCFFNIHYRYIKNISLVFQIC